MGVRSVRFYDVVAVHGIEANQSAQVLWPSSLEAPHSATYLALASAWQDVNQTLFTFVLRERGELLGLIQGAARSGHDAWDLLRLAVTPTDPEDRERAAGALIDELQAATGGRGALRTFARVASDEGATLLGRQGFRRYTSEYTLTCDRLDLAPIPLPEHLEFRARRPADAWGIFQLYCSVAPAPVRHAEGLSSKRWTGGPRIARALLGHLSPPREVVLTDEGLVVGWVRLHPLKRQSARRLEVMLHPRAYDVLPALLVHAFMALEVGHDHPLICLVREYEQAVLSGLQEVGFTVRSEHSLLVKHTATRVTERQLLIAALRAQSLGIDVSRYQHSETAVQGLSLVEPYFDD